MADNLLSIVQKACGRIGLERPTGVAGSSEVTAAQMFDLAIEEGDELHRIHDWSALVVEGATITLVAGQESYPLPDDFSRLVHGTTWDRTNKWRTDGPDTPQKARWRREGLNEFGLRRAIRQRGNSITVWPVPTASGDVIAYDYVSRNWAVSLAGLPIPQFSADTDQPLLPAHLFILGLKWRFMAAKGMEFSALQGAYGGDVRRAIAHDMGGGRVLRLDGGASDDEGNCDDVIAGAPTVVLGTDGGEGIAIE